jgi:hypothetical protein
MTIEALKESLHDRCKSLEGGLSVLRSDFLQRPRAEAKLEGQIAEVEACLHLVESLQLDEGNPLLELRDGCVRRVPWGKLERHNWPNSTFGGLVWDWEKCEPVNSDDESEPGVNRHDPSRC